MANIIIKSTERQQFVNDTLKSFGHNLSTASKEMREHAEHVAQKSQEITQKVRESK